MMSQQSLDDELLSYLAELLDGQDDDDAGVDRDAFECLILAAGDFRLGIALSDVAGIRRLGGTGQKLSEPLELLTIDSRRYCVAEAEWLLALNDSADPRSRTGRVADPARSSLPLVLLKGGHWALRCDRIAGVQLVQPETIRRRSGARRLTRPWLAGVFGEPPAILLDHAGLLAMLQMSLRSLAIAGP